MATPDSSPHLKSVLYSYSRQAMNTLQGPGTHIVEHRKIVSDQQASGYNYKKAFIYDAFKRANEDSCKKCDFEIVQVPMRPKCPPDANWQTTITPCVEGDRSPATQKPRKKDETKIILIKNDPVLKKAAVENCDPVRPRKRIEKSFGGCFSAPPFSPKPLPVLASADPGVLPSLHGRSETYLDGEPIACFYIGGEPRLCLPQILNTVLRNFSLTQIYAICDELQIFCSICTPAQLDYLKDTGILPPPATSCGLITKTDAQRLTHALFFSILLRPAPPHLNPDKYPNIRISHNCFGKCKALAWTELYTSSASPCIECLECSNLFTPMQFVCHAHKNVENRTCHWGFDADNWRTYLMLAKEQNQPRFKAEEELQTFKNKFDSANHKRKQAVDMKDDAAKKVRNEDLISNFDSNYLNKFVACGSCNNGGGGGAPPAWAIERLVTRDGKRLPLPPPLFVKDSMPSSIPHYLSQGPPVLMDPTRVVPLSESEKFERNFQPNVALVPLNIRDKGTKKDSGNLKDEQLRMKSPMNQILFQKQTHSNEAEVVSYVKLESGVELEALKANLMQASEEDELTVVKLEIDSFQESSPAADLKLHPDLELSTTDSDTESMNSVTSKSEVVEEAEALLRGWTDRAAARKVLDIVASLAKISFEKDKKLGEASKEKARLQYTLHMYKKEQGARQKDEEHLHEKLSANEHCFRVKKEP